MLYIYKYRSNPHLSIIYTDMRWGLRQCGSVHMDNTVQCTDLTAVWAEAWVACAGQDKTPGGTQAGAHDTAGLSWDTDQEGSMTPVSEEKQHTEELFKK